MSQLFTIQDAAKQIGVKPFMLFIFLRENDFLSKRNLPRTRYIVKDMFHIRHTKFKHPVLGEQVSSRTFMTPKGIDHIHELIRHKAPEALCAGNRTAANETTDSACIRTSA